MGGAECRAWQRVAGESSRPRNGTQFCSLTRGVRELRPTEQKLTLDDGTEWAFRLVDQAQETHVFARNAADNGVELEEVGTVASKMLFDRALDPEERWRVRKSVAQSETV